MASNRQSRKGGSPLQYHRRSDCNARSAAIGSHGLDWVLSLAPGFSRVDQAASRTNRFNGLAPLRGRVAGGKAWLQLRIRRRGRMGKLLETVSDVGLTRVTWLKPGANQTASDAGSGSPACWRNGAQADIFVCAHPGDSRDAPTVFGTRTRELVRLSPWGIL
jgi:hypothetical protein